MHTETYYRLHANPNAPCLCPEHAYSGLWGAEWDADGSRNQCRQCDGTGTDVALGDECPVCDGEGWEDALPGYSACHTARDLVEYMDHHGIVTADDPVAIFEGCQVGNGFDGEPLVIPTGDIRWTTWAELVRMAQEETWS